MINGGTVVPSNNGNNGTNSNQSVLTSRLSHEHSRSISSPPSPSDLSNYRNVNGGSNVPGIGTGAAGSSCGGGGGGGAVAAHHLTMRME
ncbi:hypothetical protein BLOT_010069 [Blomia tropicalis]|nr:hypothetical protein BLOT_010069 [Blomia tropicalis]